MSRSERTAMKLASLYSCLIAVAGVLAAGCGQKTESSANIPPSCAQYLSRVEACAPKMGPAADALRQSAAASKAAWEKAAASSSSDVLNSSCKTMLAQIDAQFKGIGC